MRTPLRNSIPDRVVRGRPCPIDRSSSNVVDVNP